MRSMTRYLPRTFATTLVWAVAACSNSAPMGMMGDGGSKGTGGIAATGGSSGGGTGGQSTGGTPATGGSNSDGGSGGKGGTSPGTGGNTGGTSPGTGGSAAGSGGSGGSATGGSGQAGAPGSFCISGDCTAFAGSWDGALELFPCSSSGSGYDCPNACPAGGGKTTTFAYPVKGTSGTTYDVTFEAKGIVEVHAYQNTTFPASYTNPIKGNGDFNNLFSIGGTQAASGNGNDYNTYELDVSPAVPGLTNVAGTGSSQYNVYYLNAVPANENPHINGGPTQHLTFSIDDVATIKVMGGGTVTLKSYDSNCVEVQNCGVTSGSTCTSPKSISLAGATPPAPTLAQPYQTSTGHGQFLFFDIKNVTVAQ